MYIIGSLGPNIENFSEIKELIECGMNTVRLNCSHGNKEAFKRYIEYIRENHKEVKVLQDLQGNKIRVSSIMKSEIKIVEGEEVYFCDENLYRKIKDKYLVIPLSMSSDFRDLYLCKKIYMKDGTMEFKVVALGNKENFMKCVCVKGGIIRGEKGVNAPGMNRSSWTLTDKDIEDIKWGIENKVDIICLSYVIDSNSLKKCKKIIKDIDKDNSTKLWAKIECREGLDNFNDIIKYCDGIMIGRGDLVGEISQINVPLEEIKIVNSMKRSKKDLIIATYVLDSMKKNNSPTLPEIESIMNFLNSGVAGFMLAGETAVGKYRREAMSTLKNVVELYKKVKTT